MIFKMAKTDSKPPINGGRQCATLLFKMAERTHQLMVGSVLYRYQKWPKQVRNHELMVAGSALQEYPKWLKELPLILMVGCMFYLYFFRLYLSQNSLTLQSGGNTSLSLYDWREV